MNFTTIAKAILLFYRERNSLFAGQVLSDKLNEPLDVVRSEIKELTGMEPEQLVTHLERSKIKRVITETAKNIKEKEDAAVPEVNIEAMAEEKERGKNLSINYSYADTRFGPVIIASTNKGICYLAFADGGRKKAYAKLKERFAKANFKEAKDNFQSDALSFFKNGRGTENPIQLHLKRTPFQIKTYQKLLEIPLGGLMSYGGLTDDPKNSHALGAAVGSNPVAYIIPCHRAVHTSGEFGQYHWGKARKAALICLEAVQAGEENGKNS